MSISGILAALPNGRAILTVAVSSLLGGLVAIGIVASLDRPAGPAQPAYDPSFVKIGRTYLPELGKTYAGAWEDGAKAIDAGQPLSAAIAVVGKSWDAGRSQLFDRLATPEFAHIVPESQRDADVTPAQRAAMAAAWRGFARGLGR